SGRGRGHRDRDQRRRPADRYVPGFREGGAARQQDVFRRADYTLADEHRRLLPTGAQSVQEQGDGAQDAEGAALRAGGPGARSEEGRGRQAEDRHLVGQSNPILRVPAVHHGERPPHGAEGDRRAEGDGRRPRSLHRGVFEAVREQGGVTSFVEAARREKLAELVRRGVAGFAYRFERTGAARAALEGFREGDATVHRLAGRLVLLRSMGKTTFGHLEDASGRTQVYCQIDALRAEQNEAGNLLRWGDGVRVGGAVFAALSCVNVTPERRRVRSRRTTKRSPQSSICGSPTSCT